MEMLNSEIYNEMLNSEIYNCDLGDFTMGISRTGMVNYKEQLRISILVDVVKKISEIDDIEKTINAGWRGISKMNFLDDFKVAREQICNDLTAEYNDLVDRLDELSESYFEQDAKLYSKEGQ